MYQTQGTLFDKLNSFGLQYTKEQTFFENFAIFEFESICVQKESFNFTDTTKWIGKHIPILVSIYSKIVKEPLFLCNSDPHHHVISFICALEKLVLQNRAKLKSLFFYIEATTKNKRGFIFKKLTQGQNRGGLADLDDCNSETLTLTQFLQIQKKQVQTCRSIWNVIAMFYLSLVSGAQLAIST